MKFEEQVEKLWATTKECMVEILGNTEALVDTMVDEFRKTYEKHPERLRGFEVIMDERKYRDGIFGFIQPLLIAEYISGNKTSFRLISSAYNEIANKNSWLY